MIPFRHLIFIWTFTAISLGAACAQTNVLVTATVATGCDISGSSSGELAAATLNFGAWPAAGVMIRTTSGNAYIRCNAPAANVTITLDGGAHALSGQRQLANSGTTTLPYDLFQDVAETQPWTAGVPYSIAIGSTAPLSIPIHGRMVVPTGAADGTYTDTVKLSVEY